MSTVGYINISLETFGGMLSLIFILCLILTGHKKERSEKLYICVLSINTIVLFCDAAAWLFKGRPGDWSFYLVRIANFCVFCFSYILLAVFTEYLVCIVSSKGSIISKLPSRIMWGLSFAAILLVVISQFNNMYYIIDAYNIYHRQHLFWLSQMFGILCMLIDGSVLFLYRKRMEKRELAAFAAYIGMPIIAMFIQMLIYGVAVLYLATTVSAMCIYISIQIEHSRNMAVKELELEKTRTIVMLSQIQPHFLYNTLSVIKGLCRTNPNLAEEAVDHFSDFLRGNLKSLTYTELIPFEQELAHTKHYLQLEQMRFGSRLQISYEIPAVHFLLPPLTLQPLVENAVRHGIMKQEEGGTITIASSENDDSYTITVADNGIGFDVDIPHESDTEHVGLNNVQKRLSAQCNGRLAITSTPGLGSSVTITIPKGTP